MLKVMSSHAFQSTFLPYRKFKVKIQNIEKLSSNRKIVLERCAISSKSASNSEGCRWMWVQKLVLHNILKQGRLFGISQDMLVVWSDCFTLVVLRRTISTIHNFTMNTMDVQKISTNVTNINCSGFVIWFCWSCPNLFSVRDAFP